jgi:hypothetical protein
MLTIIGYALFFSGAVIGVIGATSFRGKAVALATACAGIIVLVEPATWSFDTRVHEDLCNSARDQLDSVVLKLKLAEIDGKPDAETAGRGQKLRRQIREDLPFCVDQWRTCIPATDNEAHEHQLLEHLEALRAGLRSAQSCPPPRPPECARYSQVLRNLTRSSGPESALEMRLDEIRPELNALLARCVPGWEGCADLISKRQHRHALPGRVEFVANALYSNESCSGIEDRP